jgi:hypothetical protein
MPDYSHTFDTNAPATAVMKVYGPNYLMASNSEE